MRKLTRNMLVLCCLLTLAQAQADVLVLKDGDSISGTLLRISDGIVVFRTKLEGQMMAPVDTVRNLSTDLPQVLTLKNPDEDAFGKLLIQEGETYLIPINAGERQRIDVARIWEANPLPASTEADTEEVDATNQQSTFNVGTGVMSRTGEKDTTDLVARVGASTTTDKVNMRLNALLQRADSNDFPAFLSAEATLEGNSNKINPLAQIGVTRDTDNALNLRTDFTLGMNYQFSQLQDSVVTGLVGVNYSIEDWHRDHKHRWMDEDKDKDELGLKLGLRYSKALSDNTTLNGELTFIPALTDFGTFHAYSNANILKNLTDQLHLRLDIMLNYDSDPAFIGLQPWNAGIGAGIDWRF